MRTPPYFDSLREVLSREFEVAPDKPEETLDGTLHALWFAASGDQRSVEGSDGSVELPPLDEGQRSVLKVLVERRISGIPLSHLTRRQRFLGIDFIVGPEALIPRKETEILGRAALEALRERAGVSSAPVVLDVCTGCGNLALALARHQAECRVYASDICERALGLARENAEHLGLDHRVELRVGDLFGPFADELQGGVDVITCNPPYISTGKVPTLAPEISANEPARAFDGGPFGVSILVKLIQQAPALLKPNGWLCFELGLGQGPAIRKRLEKGGLYQEIREHHDSAGAIRAISARLAGSLESVSEA